MKSRCPLRVGTFSETANEMLVLSRRIAESVLIGDNIEIEILDICGSQVKLGIRAPREIAVLRSELVVTMRQNTLAAQAIPDHLIRHVVQSFK